MLMCEEMIKLRRELDKLGIEWRDASDDNISRTHFDLNNNSYSVICGRGTYGHEVGALELMTSAINGGEPVGWLSAENIIEKINSIGGLKW
jgi:hypothetical protein